MKPGGPDSQFSFPEDWDLLCEFLPELSRYNKANRGCSSSKDVLLKLYSHQRVDETPEAMAYLVRANELILKETPYSGMDRWTFKSVPSVRDVLNACLSMNLAAHPGYPWGIHCSNKRDFVVHHFPHLYLFVCVRILSWRYVVPFCKTTRDFLEAFAVDASLVAEKNEVKKVDKDARIFLMGSIITEAAERCFIDSAAEMDKFHWGKHYSCIGIGFSVEHCDRFMSRIPSDLPLCTNDVPKFDVTRTKFERQLDAIVLLSQKGCPVDHPLVDIVYGSVESACHPLVVFADGSVWVAKKGGSTLTGERGTSKGNTTTRARRSFASSLFIKEMRIQPLKTSLFELPVMTVLRVIII